MQRCSAGSAILDEASRLCVCAFAIRARVAGARSSPTYGRYAPRSCGRAILGSKSGGSSKPRSPPARTTRQFLRD